MNICDPWKKFQVISKFLISQLSETTQGTSVNPLTSVWAWKVWPEYNMEKNISKIWLYWGPQMAPIGEKIKDIFELRWTYVTHEKNFKSYRNFWFVNFLEPHKEHLLRLCQNTLISFYKKSKKSIQAQMFLIFPEFEAQKFLIFEN